MYYIGVDPSLSSTGVAILDEDGSYELKSISSKKEDCPGSDIIRIMVAQKALKQMLQGLMKKNKIYGVAIEGVSFGSNNANHAAIVGMNYALRIVVAELGLTIAVVSPMSLKKSLFGIGNFSKNKKVDGVVAWKKFNTENEIGAANSDELDAYGLAHVLAKISLGEAVKCELIHGSLFSSSC
jgi:Holliday junction resolvasome RuvABC endonuclease subunit